MDEDEIETSASSTTDDGSAEAVADDDGSAKAVADDDDAVDAGASIVSSDAMVAGTSFRLEILTTSSRAVSNAAWRIL